MSYFIFSMLFAGLMEMPPVSNVTPLPTSPSTGAPGAASWAFVAHDDHARRLDAALRHADQRAHFQFGDSSFVENLDAEADFLRHGFGVRRENARRELVRRLVDQVAREILRFGDDAAVVDRGCKVIAETGIKARQRDGLNFAVLFLRAVFVRFEIGGDQALRPRPAPLPDRARLRARETRSFSRRATSDNAAPFRQSCAGR